MKQSNILFAIGAALLMAGCSADDERTSYGTGRLDFAVTASADVANVTSRASEIKLPTRIPTENNLKLHLVGTYTDKDGQAGTYDEIWETLAIYKADNPRLECGNSSYAATFTYGDPEVEGEDAAYFEGYVGGINLTADITTTASVTVSLANSCFRVLLDDWMTTYYSNIKLTISTDRQSFQFTEETATDDRVIFVKPGQKLKFSGSAEVAQTGVPVSFGTTEIGNGSLTTVRTMHTIRVTQSQAGGASIEVGFDDSFTEIDNGVIEF